MTATDVTKKKTPYRILEDYETVREGDKAIYHNRESWDRCTVSFYSGAPYVGAPAGAYSRDNLKVGRMIREVPNLPGWRYLDAEEKARIGDQPYSGARYVIRMIEGDPMIRDYEPRPVETAEKPDDEPRVETKTKTIYIRRLRPHEVIRKGDRFGTTVNVFDQMMMAGGFSIGNTAKSSNVWREVRLRTPLTRWLDVGEMMHVRHNCGAWAALGSGAQAVKVPIDFPSVNDAFNGFIPVPDEKIERRPEPKWIECGCGKHSYLKGADPYAAHHAYVTLNEEWNETMIQRVRGVGVSDRPVVSVLADDMSGEDIAADAPTAEDYLTRSQIVI